MNSKERHEARYQRRNAKREERKRMLNDQFGNYEKIFSFDNLYDAYQKSCRGVGWKASTQTYRLNSLLNVNIAHKQLMAGTYKGKGFYAFDIFERGKPRRIRSVHISERVVQRCLCDYALVPMFSRSFIYDNGASMKDKGIDFALNRMNCHLQRHWRKHGNEGYALVIDFSKFFDRIQHEPLLDEFKKRFTDERLLEFTRQLIKAFGDVGLGIGSQISQICALLYPNRIDHFVKEVLRIKHYARYMDDSYLIHPSKAYLQECLVKIRAECDKLGIVLNPKKTQIVKLSRGITFLKTRFNITDTGRIVRRPNKKSITAMRRKLKKFKKWNERGTFKMEDIETSFTSWKGHIGRCNSYRTMQSMTALYLTLFAVPLLELQATKGNVHL